MFIGERDRRFADIRGDRCAGYRFADRGAGCRVLCSLRVQLALEFRDALDQAGIAPGAVVGAHLIVCAHHGFETG